MDSRQSHKKNSKQCFYFRVISWVSACPVKFFAEEERSGFNRGGQQYPMKEIKLLVLLDWPLFRPAAALNLEP